MPESHVVRGKQPRLTLRGLVSIALARKWTFLTVTLVIAALVIAWATLATPSYRVAVKLVPRQADNQSAGLQPLLGQIGGIASLAGLGAFETVDEQEAIAWLKARAFGDRFIAQHQMMPQLFSDIWDPEHRRWRVPDRQVPTADDAWATFDHQIRRVAQDQKTRIVTLEVVWRDRQTAAAWANDIAADANAELRDRALRDADRTLVSLQDQLNQTASVELQQAIYRLMEVQVKKKVLALSRPDYAFSILDPAVVPDERRYDSPKRGLLIFLAFPIGLLLASAVALAGHAFAQLRADLRAPTL